MSGPRANCGQSHRSQRRHYALAYWPVRSMKLQPAGPIAEQLYQEGSFLQTPMDPPIGYTGPSGVLPREQQESSHFVPIEDRWRIGYPEWDRYGNGHPVLDEYPYLPGAGLIRITRTCLKVIIPSSGSIRFST